MRQKKIWSKEEEDVIKCNYPNIHTIAEILQNRSVCAISQHINKMGMSLRNRRWTKEEDDIMRNDYHLTNTKELAKKLNRSASSVVLRARKLNLNKSNSIYRKTNCRKLLDGSLQSMYWIGFILADGHITANYKLKIALSSTDISHLKQLALYINANVHTKPYGKNSFNIIGEQCYISVKDIDNIKMLAENYQIQKNKTKMPPNFQMYNLTNDQWIALIIGFIDGDGSITTAKRISSPINIKFKNHKSWLMNLHVIKNKLCEITNINSKMNAKINSNGYASLTISDNRIITQLKKFIITNNICALSRKWNQINENFSTTRNKLSASQIKEIQSTFTQNNNVNKSKLAKKYHVSISAITTAINKIK